MPIPLKKNNVKVSGNQNTGKTLVFGHGFGTDQSAWRFILPSFENDYKIITFDLVGSHEGTYEYYNQIKYSKLTSFAYDLLDLSEAMHLKDAIFIGHSVSGMIGLLASQIAHDFFKEHVFMNASPRYLNDPDAKYVGGFNQSDLNDLYEAMASNYNAWVAGFSSLAMSNNESPELAKEFARTLSAVRPDIALSVSKAIFESDHRSNLDGFTKRSLIIQSVRDIAVPLDVAYYLKDKFLNSQLAIIKAEGHFPHISAPEEISSTILEFLNN